MSQYFPLYRTSGGNTKEELDLSSYATKTDLKNVTHVDVSSFPLKTNLANLKTEVDKIDVDKLKTVPVEVTRRTEYNKLVTKVDNKMPNVWNFVKKTDYNKN